MTVRIEQFDEAEKPDAIGAGQVPETTPRKTLIKQQPTPVVDRGLIAELVG